MSKVVVVEVWGERHVSIDRHQVAEILRVLTRERVHREVRACQRVHESVETALDHIKEWVAHWVMFRSTSRQMFQDVRLSGMIIRWRPEHDRENVVRVTAI